MKVDPTSVTENFMRNLKSTFAIGITALSLSIAPTLAEQLPTTHLQLDPLPGMSVWNSDATVTPLAFDSDKKPKTILIKVPANQQAKKAHATSDGNVRFAIVLSGTLYYADGDVVDKSKEKAYPAGSVLLISSGVKHWVSTRETPLKMILTATNPANLTPLVKKQLK